MRLLRCYPMDAADGAGRGERERERERERGRETEREKERGRKTTADQAALQSADAFPLSVFSA